jgi:hypothetical protein
MFACGQADGVKSVTVGGCPGRGVCHANRNADKVFTIIGVADGSADCEVSFLRGKDGIDEMQSY